MVEALASYPPPPLPTVHPSASDPHESRGIAPLPALDFSALPTIDDIAPYQSFTTHPNPFVECTTPRRIRSMPVVLASLAEVNEDGPDLDSAHTNIVTDRSAGANSSSHESGLGSLDTARAPVPLSHLKTQSSPTLMQRRKLLAQPVQRGAGQSRLVSVTPTIVRIFVYMNDDPLFYKRPVMLDLKQSRTMDTWFTQLTSQLQPSFGPVCRIHDLDGKEVESFVELRELQAYVLCGRKPFRKMAYEGILSLREREQQISNAASAAMQKYSTARAQYMAPTPKTTRSAIWVVCNGPFASAPAKMLLTKHALSSLDLVYQAISERLKALLLYGAVRKLYTLGGVEVTDASALVVNTKAMIYVAVERGNFVKPAIDPLFRGIPDAQEVSPVGGVRKKPVARLARAGVAERVYNELIDEAIAEILREVVGLQNRSSKTSQDESKSTFTRSYDNLIPTIIECMMRPIGTADQLDEYVRAHYQDVTTAATRGRLHHWERQPLGLAALVIVLDQFPRSIWRNTAAMFRFDNLAREVVLRGIKSKVEEQMLPVHRTFVCIALSHQEGLEMQQLCMQQWDAIKSNFHADDHLLDCAVTFRMNLDIITRFGRFPGRNTLLCRTSTAAEARFLEDSLPPLPPVDVVDSISTTHSTKPIAEGSPSPKARRSDKSPRHSAIEESEAGGGSRSATGARDDGTDNRPLSSEHPEPVYPATASYHAVREPSISVAPPTPQSSRREKGEQGGASPSLGGSGRDGSGTSTGSAKSSLNLPPLRTTAGARGKPNSRSSRSVAAS